ncbi:hypothetical protein H112_00860 [Trichophyton rubrum D6]|uniref:Uncharacterized protein n=3 Tax=Trichophyton TaxID=5550 RepID=A0A080WPT6_TRIRC|nr:uncharacterized protein TERG_12622 [Trichophyton rubrum CBS 118892]EZF27049.1 hypothetical protein H100_00858 [Trichophyton rubrum MR850]EZF46144.1 hypothetical protein H102_00850 [Trichophyton rubrum CBS 100081]EZF56760.1 hypothetical protein H103_00858 [Trichophyton rubrum CBS 288.86]EZF67401.1 hypothetical protein H104_00842 [Trichophyton rubrum CBS 289.86]EZF78001.1 hypothetical protein H105_00856 [Trichophyton soudanense CBS 452.61]EZF88725.1 hypothetical protein H110_00858 [Trichophy
MPCATANILFSTFTPTARQREKSSLLDSTLAKSLPPRKQDDSGDKLKTGWKWPKSLETLVYRKEWTWSVLRRLLEVEDAINCLKPWATLSTLFSLLLVCFDSEL